MAAAGDGKRQDPDPDPPRGPLQREVTGAPGEVTDRSRRHSLDRLWFRCRRCRVVRVGFGPELGWESGELLQPKWNSFYTCLGLSSIRTRAKRTWPSTASIFCRRRHCGEILTGSRCPRELRMSSRWLVIGVIDGKWWSAVVTYRADRTRIIAVRRSREGEVALYEG